MSDKPKMSFEEVKAMTYEFISSHQEEITPGWKICEKTGINGTETLRSAIADLREGENPICSCRAGYWWGQTDDEVEATAAGLESRAYAMLRAAAGMRRRKIGQISMDEEA